MSTKVYLIVIIVSNSSSHWLVFLNIPSKQSLIWIVLLVALDYEIQICSAVSFLTKYTPSDCPICIFMPCSSCIVSSILLINRFLQLDSLKWCHVLLYNNCPVVFVSSQSTRMSNNFVFDLSRFQMDFQASDSVVYLVPKSVNLWLLAE